MFANFATAITSSTAVTLALFYVMNLLIAMQPGAIVDERDRHRLIWNAYVPPEDVIDELEHLPKKEFIEPPQPPTNQPPTDPHAATSVTTRTPPPPPANKYGGTSVLGVDGPLVVLVRPQPVYPASKQKHGIEGYVLVEFDVQVDGRVTNVRVIESSDAGFERSALRAAQRFRFKPRVVDGIALASPGIRNLFRYQMESE